jgi:hypothetical protein
MPLFARNQFTKDNELFSIIPDDCPAIPHDSQIDDSLLQSMEDKVLPKNKTHFTTTATGNYNTLLL